MQTKFLELSAGRLAFEDYGGGGQLVLMLPGMAALRSEYRFLAPKLSEAGFRPVQVDLRGQGESSVPWPVYDIPSVGSDILSLVDYLGPERVHLIGTSFGAAPIVWTAVECPELVRSLVLINPFVRQQKINPVMSALFWIMLHNPWRVRTWMAYYSSLYPSRKPADFQHYLQQLAENLSQPGRFDAAEALGTSSRQPSDERLERVRAPSLVVMGSKDPDYPDPAGEGKIVADRMGGQLELIDGAGHYPQSEMPEKTAPIVIDFLRNSAE